MQARVGIALGVVVALEVLDPAEHRVVRAPGPADEVQQREAIAIPTPQSTPSSATPANATIASANSEPPPAAQPPRRRDVDEAEHGDDHDRRERAQRQVVHQAGAERQQQRQDDRRRTRPANWLRAPMSSATAVRELLVEIGKP